MFKAPTRLKNGVNNLSAEHKFANLPVPSLVDHAVTLQDHFLKFNASEWTVGGTGTPTRSMDNTKANGVLNATTSAASGDSNFVCTQASAWRTTRATLDTSPATLMFGVRLLCTSGANSRITAGLLTGATNSDVFPTTLNGIAFTKAGGAGFLLTIGNGTSQQTTTVTSSYSASSWVDLAFVLDKQVITVFVNGVKTNIVTDLSTMPSTTAGLFAAFGQQNQSAAAISLLVDYVLVSGDVI